MIIVDCPPNCGTYTGNPPAQWCRVCGRRALSLLTSQSVQDIGNPHLIYYNGAGCGRPAEVVQIYFTHWTFHAQCCVYGKEAERPDKYGNLSGKVLISLDVEPGGGAGQKRISHLRKFLSDAAIPECRNAIAGGPSNNLVAEHVIWETLDIANFDERLVLRAAERLARYAAAIPILMSAARNWDPEANVLFR